jgi:hypothetical protein
MADGNLTFDTRINNKNLSQDLKSVRKTIENSIPDDAFKNLQTAFTNSINEIKNFKTEMANMSDDGVFKYGNLTDAQKKYYDDMVQGSNNLEKSIKSVETGFTLADKAARRLKAVMITMGVGLALGAITGLIDKLWGLLKDMFVSADTEANKLDRTIRNNLNKSIKEQRKALKDTNKELEEYRKKLDKVSKEIERQQTTVATELKSIKPRNDGYVHYNDLLEKKAQLEAKSTKEVNNLIGEEAELKQEIEDLEKAQTAYNKSIEAGSKNPTENKIGKNQFLDNSNKPIDFEGGTFDFLIPQEIMDGAIDQAHRLSDEYVTLSNIMTTQLAQGFSDSAEELGKLLATGGNTETWKALGKMMIDSAVQAYSGVADQLIAWGTLATFAPSVAKAQGITSDGGMMLAQGLVMKVTAGMIKSAGKYSQGGVVGGNSTSGDKLFALVNSKETILNQGQSARAVDMITRGGGGGAPVINIYNNASDQVGASAGQDVDGSIRIMVESVVVDTLQNNKGKNIMRNLYGVKPQGVQ